MAVKIYQDEAWHDLVGQKVYANGEWITLKAQDRLFFNNQWHWVGDVTNYLFAWGYNVAGQLGLGDTTDRDVPTRVGTATDWVSMVSGGYHSLAINSSGELFAWGAHSSGQLGLGDTTSRNVPTQVGTATDWVSVVSGYQHSLAINSSGELFAWGYNEVGQLGLGDNTINRNVPTQVGTATDWVSVVGGVYHSLAINSSGELFAWGYNYDGQLGLGDNTINRNVPTQVGTATDWVSVVGGYQHSLALKAPTT